MKVQLEQGVRLADVRAELLRHYDAQAVEVALLRVRVDADGYVAQDATLELRPRATTPAAGLPAPAPQSSEERATFAAERAKRSFLDKFADRQVERLLERELKQALTLGPANLEVRNAVLERSPDPAQQAFLRAHPRGRILSTSIRVSGDSGSALQLGQDLRGAVGGAYEIRVELPFDDFAGVAWEKQWENAKRRLEPLYTLAKLPSDRFWDEVRRLELPPGARIVRVFDVHGGAKIGDADLSVDADRRTQVIFDVKWTAADRVDVTFDTLRSDVAGLALRLGDVGATVRAPRSNHRVHTYTGLPLRGEDAEQSIAALKEAIAWQNGLLPARVDTDRLDQLGRGRHSLDLLAGRQAGANVFAPIGAHVGVGVGGGLQGQERLTVTLPDHGPGGRLIDQEEAGEWITALQRRDAARLQERVVPGLVAQAVYTGERNAELTLRLNQGTALIPGWLGVGAVTSFARSLRDTDVVGTRIAYDAEDPQRVTVRLWKIDTRVMARRFALEAGLTLDPAVQGKISEALAEHLLGGVGLERYAADLGEAAYGQLKTFTDRLKLQIAHSRENTAFGYESLAFTGLDLRRGADREAFAALIGAEEGPRSPAALATAIENGHLSEVIVRERDERRDAFSAKFMGLNLLSVDSSEWQGSETQRFRVAERVATDPSTGERSVVEEWLTLKLTEAGVARERRGPTESYRFTASAHAVTRVTTENGVPRAFAPVEVWAKVSHENEDSLFYRAERRRLEGGAAAAGFEVLAHEVGDSRWLFGKHYGEVRVGLRGVISREGWQQILAGGPEAAGRAGLLTAASVKGVDVPPSELRTPDALVPVAFRAANAPPLGADQAELLRLLRTPWEPDVAPEKMRRVRERVLARAGESQAAGQLGAAAAARLAALPPGELDELIYRAQASELLEEYRAKSQSGAASDADAQRELDELRTGYHFLTERFAGRARNLPDDLWIVEQGLALEKVFADPGVVQATRAMRESGELRQEEIDDLIERVFASSAKSYRPAVTVLSPSEDEEALTFWVTLFRLAGTNADGQPAAMGLFDVDGKRYRFVAATPGLDRELLDSILQRGAKAALDEARRNAGGPAAVQP